MNTRLKRVLNYSLVGSVCLSALMAITFVLLNTWGWFEVRVILTTIVCAGASLCVMGCELARTPKGKNLLPLAGFALTAATTGMLLVGMWTDTGSEGYWKLTTILSCFAVATVHVCVLSAVPLATRFKWVNWIAIQMSYGLAFLMSLIIVERFRFEDMTIRLVVTLAILDVAITLVIPILSRIGKSDVRQVALQTPLEQRNAAAIDQEIAILRERIAELETMKLELNGQVNDSKTYRRPFESDQSSDLPLPIVGRRNVIG